MTIGPPRGSGFYPFALLDEAKQKALAAGIDLIDLGMGDPRDPTPEWIRQALIAAIEPVSSYPKAAGLPELRAAIAAWLQRRFGADVDPDTSIMPTLGAKEIAHSLAAYAIDGDRNLIVVPTPAYPVYDRGARFHGGEVLQLPLLPRNGFLPDLSLVPESTWRRTAILWLNYPNNPTGACAPLEIYEHAAQLARRHGFLLASDEAYSEIYFGEPPVSALQLEDHTNVVAINTLSKRSCMTGYRSGFIAGDPTLLATLRKYRPSVGVTPQDFVQSASIAAWNDEDHVRELRERWAGKRTVLLEALQSADLRVESEATFFLWVAHSSEATSAEVAAGLLEAGIVVSPGSFFGAAGEGFIRLALVASMDDCTRAAERLANFAWNQ